MQTKIIAHRGASAYLPENTLPAFQLAMEQGAKGFELDIHLTKDDHVVVAHDLTLERVSNGTGRICDYNLAELRELDFGNHATLPTLAEVYALVADTNLTINVELKTTEELYPAMPEKLIRLEKEYGIEDRVLYSSFNHYSLLAIRQHNKDAGIGILYDLGLVDPWVYAKQLGANAIHPHYKIIAALPETVARCHKEGIQVNIWTVDDPQAIKYMLSLGVDNLITNVPDVAIKILKEQTHDRPI
ncbi:MAG: glycerophosphodiester phosphodiesterase [Defluviitaleaceae bacterium]|nr:glycerophosphodiester phosphodiesterase [Defluviitaleaceae bacterium]